MTYGIIIITYAGVPGCEFKIIKLMNLILLDQRQWFVKIQYLFCINPCPTEPRYALSLQIV